MFERDDTVGYIDPVQRWMFPPNRREALANVYCDVTRMVEREDREDFLRVAYNELWLFCSREGYVCEEMAQAFLGRAVHLDCDLLRAVMHQMLCKLLMRAACMPQCIKACCCNCAAAPDDISCAKRVFAI